MTNWACIKKKSAQIRFIVGFRVWSTRKCASNDHVITFNWELIFLSSSRSCQINICVMPFKCEITYCGSWWDFDDLKYWHRTWYRMSHDGFPNKHITGFPASPLLWKMSFAIILGGGEMDCNVFFPLLVSSIWAFLITFVTYLL